MTKEDIDERWGVLTKFTIGNSSGVEDLKKVIETIETSKQFENRVFGAFTKFKKPAPKDIHKDIYEQQQQVIKEMQQDFQKVNEKYRKR